MIKEKIDENIKNSLKKGEQVELRVWRSIKTAFKNYEVEKAGNIITDDIEIKIISKLISSHKDSIKEYTNANRMDLVEIEKSELDILLSLVPKEPTDEEIEKEINKFIKDFFTLTNGLPPTIKNMKDCINYVHKQFPMANGGKISKIYKNKI